MIGTLIISGPYALSLIKNTEQRYIFILRQRRTLQHGKTAAKADQLWFHHIPACYIFSDFRLLFLRADYCKIITASQS